MSSWPSIRIEGGLFGSDLLDQVASGDLPGQKPKDFGLEGRRSLTDEISAVFSEARSQWKIFQNRFARFTDPNDPATSITRDSWIIPLLSALGFDLRYNARAFDVDGRSFAVSHRAGEAEDAPPIHIVGARQELGRLAPSGRPRLAPHSLVQEYLNRTEIIWGIVTNGLTLRLLRDSTFIRRQSYLEFDLSSMMEDQLFLDFSIFYRLLHRSRFPQGIADGPDCLLEKYHAYSLEQGGRVRERLRDGVEKCLVTLANGFLSHPDNSALRQNLSEGRLTPERFYQQLLRLVYRFLFLLVAEDRGLISRDPLYRGYYGIGRLRPLLDKRASFTDREHDDIWEGLRVLWTLFGDERLAPLLALAPLNGELFAPLDIDACSLSNYIFLEGFQALAEYRENPSSPARRVNYAALDVEEMGSVYESLLEFHPIFEISADGRPSFVLSLGSERKTTGSYYSTPELVNELVQSALAPVIDERLKTANTLKEKEQAVISIKVCDPACGSGHFLLAAARRLGKELARIRTSEDEPSPERVRESVREVIAHCIYGVDKNPLAVDLCRVALWIEGHTEGKPLTYLDHRIRVGDSLVGVFDPASLKNGIPDEAFKPLTGDDKSAAREALKRNRYEKSEGLKLFGWESGLGFEEIRERSRKVDAFSDDTPTEIRKKKAAFEARLGDPEYRTRKKAFDLWTAAFFQEYKPGQPAIASAAVADALSGQPADPQLAAQAEVLALRQGFFHWPIEFPDVFARGGFDVILSNPPWEHVELKEQEYFASRNLEIANAPTQAARNRLIKELEKRDPAQYQEYLFALRLADATRTFLGNSGRYALTGFGRINTYAVFAELTRLLTRNGGRSGIIIPSGIATDDTTKYFFQDVIQSGSLISLYDFENRKGIFSSIHRSFKFCLFTCEKPVTTTPAKRKAEFIFFALDVNDLKDANRRFTLTAEDFSLLNPNTGNCPIFRSRADAELTKAIYRRVPVLWKEKTDGRPEENHWGIRFSQGLFNMASDSHHFKTSKELLADGYVRKGNIFTSPYNRYLPLYEAKMLHQFDHRWTTYEEDAAGETDSRDVTLAEKQDPNFVVQPRYWVREDIVESAIPEGFKEQKWLLGWRDICRSTDERTTISTIFPRSAVGHTYLLMFMKNNEPPDILFFISMLNSIIQDYSARQKIGGTHLSYNLFKQLAVFRPSFLEDNSPWISNHKFKDCIKIRGLELLYTSWDLAPLAKECGYNGPPFPWDEARRFELRCELDAAFFHLYLPCESTGAWKKAENESVDQLEELKRFFPTPRAAVIHVLDQFPIVRKKDEVKFGSFRTRNRILEYYDAMLESIKSGHPYDSTNVVVKQ